MRDGGEPERAALAALGLGDDDWRAWRSSGRPAADLDTWMTDRVARRPFGQTARLVYGSDDVHEEQRRRVLATLALDGGDHLLEIGCGGGLLLRDAAAAGAIVTGVDHSADMVGLARERVPTAQVIEAGAESLPFADGEFTAAAMVMVFMFLDDPGRVLRECRRVLGPNGRLVIYTPGPALRGTPALPEPIAAHSHVYEDEELAATVRDAGFERVTVTPDGGAQLALAE